MRIGSIFSGIGGLELGLERAGVGETVFQVERDPFCQRVLAHHWPTVPRFDDVCAVGRSTLPSANVVCGGFPCQDISYAGRGAGLAGARSGLWYEFARVVGEMGCEYVVVENVRALLTRGLDAVLGTLADLGYDAEWSLLSAGAVGAPQRRERLFIIAWRHQLADASRLRIDGCSGTLGRNRSDRFRPSVGHDDDPRREGHGGSDEVSLSARWDSEGRHHAAAGRGVGWADGVPLRGADGTVRLVPREVAEQGPESPLWPVADGVPQRLAQLRAVGNAVVPQVAEVVGRRLMEIHRLRCEGRL